ncbi:hypothetical protein CHISP_3147 [Chitinispirillum alkaliphilum]|nr:hypothetical protein CHISP_3147 [Chitinispirillum alkaliphilum]
MRKLKTTLTVKKCGNAYRKMLINLSVVHLLVGMSLCYAQTPLLIYLNTDESPQTIQDDFISLLGDVDVRAFGRIRDLQQFIDEHPNAPVIAPGVFIELNTDYKILLRGVSNNRIGEKFFVIAKDSDVNTNSIPELRVGILDFLGRRNISDFLTKTFGSEFGRIRRVNKREDLLTLLGMEAVDIIVVSESELALLKTETRLDLFTVVESAALVSNLPVIASKNGEIAQEVLTKLRSGSSETFQTLDIQQWRDK